jgi:HEAT repeat protein
MQDPDEDVRGAALEAVGHLGAAAATAPILARLAELMQDPDEDVRDAAAEAIDELMRPFHVGALRLFGDPPVEALPVHHLSRLFTPEPAHTIP